MKKTKSLHKLNIYQLFYQRYGIGNSISKKLCMFSGYHPLFKYKDVTANYITDKLRDFFISNAIHLDFNLKKVISDDITTMIKINSYRGMRHKNKLPARGQRNRTNGNNTKRTSLWFVKLDK